MEKPILKNEIEARITGVAKVEDNIIDAKNYALELRDYYSNLKFTEDQIGEAKEERASVNKIVKKIANYRKNIVAEFKKPIELFESTAKETEKILKETSEFVDVQVKSYEAKEKEQKKEEIKKIFDEKVEELKDVLVLEKIFDDKWLNKGTSLNQIEETITEKIKNVRDGLQVIEEMNSEFELELKNTFLTDFDMTKVILKNNRLKEQKEVLSKVEEKKEEIVKEKIETMKTTRVEEIPLDPIKTYTLKITGPLTKQRALKEFLDLNKMKYEKVD